MRAWPIVVAAAVTLLMDGRAPARAACDRCTPDATITTLYDAISVAPREAWDWPRIRALFVPQGLLASINPSKGNADIAVVTIDGLVERTEAAFAGRGFIEREYRRETFVHGNMASVYSSFYVKLLDERSEPLYRGLHHFQLLKGIDGWKIVSNVSMIENTSWRLPKRFLSVGTRRQQRD